MQKTYMQKTSEITREWHQVDATDKVLGRLASEIAQKLVGKHKPTYTPHIEAGDYVIVTNAGKVKVTGSKEEAKVYYSHSGFPGGLKGQTLATIRERHPERLIEKAVYNMLPKNRLRGDRMTRLKVYAGAEHPHKSQAAQIKSAA